MKPLLVPRTVPARPDNRSLRLVLVEDGARPIASRILPDGGDETIVVPQDRGEAAAPWADRVLGRIAALEQSHRRIAECTFLLARDVDAASMASRAIVVAALLRHSPSSGFGRIVLIADTDGAGPEQRHELLSLVETLVAGAPKSASSLVVRFVSGQGAERAREPKSGVRHCPPRADAGSPWESAHG